MRVFVVKNYNIYPMRIKILITFLLALFSITAIAQNGTIRGKVYDGKTGESITGATILLLGTTNGTISDLDGKFNLSAAPGVYTIQISFISYQTVKLEDVKLESGKVKILDDIKLQTVALDMKEIKISVKKINNNENALLAMKRHSSNVIDGISASKLKQTGDGDIASSMKRVPGISVEGGKYVYVRGLGDRYTKTVLNGLEIPGLDPDRNALQLDLFPSDIVDNVIVYKSFSADLPADFTGGVLDISIKDFPDEKMGKINVGLKYNPFFNFNPDYLYYKGGKLDFLGFDDGTRKIPAIENIPFYAIALSDPEGSDGVRFKEILKSFNPTMGPSVTTSLMDYNFGFSYGNQKVNEEKGKTYGYFLSLSYSANYEYYKDAEWGRYGMPADSNKNELELREFQKGNYGVKNVLLSGLAGFAIKSDKSKYRFNLLHLQNGESTAGSFDYIGQDKGSNFVSQQYGLDYSQRSLTNLLIDARHTFKNPDWKLSWKISPTYSRVYDPDVRFTRYEIRDGGYSIGTEVGFPERIWRNLSEENVAAVVHVEKDYKFMDRKAKLKFGSAYAFKNRDYIIRIYSMNIRGDIPLTGDPSEIFAEENLWPYQGDAGRGTTYEINFLPRNSNKFNAKTQNAAAYVSTEIQPLKKLNAIIGVRAEKYVQFYTGENQSGSEVLNNEKVLDDLNLFPTINMNYNLTEVMNLRFSYSKTIARPSFKELSYAEIYDPITGRTFIGGLFPEEDFSNGIVYWDGNLKSTDIHNFDLRWELLLFNGQMLSVSTFYKKFINPIELVQFATQTGAFQPRNVHDAQVYGVEFEIRQNLGRFYDGLKNLNVTTNVSFINSQVEMNQTEFDSRVKNARTGQEISHYREMAGQAPYLVNAGISYNGSGESFWGGFNAGLYYNVQGPTLTYVGIVDRPDIYTASFHSLNFNSSITLGKEKKSQLGLKITNLLFDKKEKIYVSYKAKDQYYERLNPGFSVKFSYSYNLF